MKKLILSLFLLFGISYAESPISTDSEVGKWKSYFGIEGGAGLFEVTGTFLGGLNPFFGMPVYLRGMSYGGSILGGWQKYTSEKIGMRNTLGLKVFVAPKTQTLSDEGIFLLEDFTKSKEDTTTEMAFYYALDGLFDFVKNGNHHFGLNFGFSVAIGGNFGRASGFSGLQLSPRLGLYTQFDNNIIDCIISVPLIGISSLFDVTFNSTLTLGYKHLF